jgi:hypothetical protein
MQRFAVEYDRRTVGIAVRVPGGFIFYACHDDFDEMDGRIFPRVRTIERHLEKTARRREDARQGRFKAANSSREARLTPVITSIGDRR